MAIKTIRVCDSCERELKERRDIYRLDIKTDSFLNGAGDRDYNLLKLEFCKDCAENIKSSLTAIKKNLNITQAKDKTELTTLEMLEELVANCENKYECGFGIVEMSNGDIIWHYSRMLFELAHVNLVAKWKQIQ